ncbi:MAG: hypothetical protein ABSB94_22160, partial [Syntrophorhabdales bacterium]
MYERQTAPPLSYARRWHVPAQQVLCGNGFTIERKSSRLNKADAKRIKKQLWSLIEGNLEKGMTKKPPEEDEACSF